MKVKHWSNVIRMPGYVGNGAAPTMSATRESVQGYPIFCNVYFVRLCNVAKCPRQPKARPMEAVWHSFVTH